MAKVAIGIGVALIALALYGYFAVPEPRSWTALIPAFAGVPLLICGLLRSIPTMRKHAMHAAATFGLLGFIAPLGRLPKTLKAEPRNNLAAFSQLAMCLLCLLFVIMCVMSFINRARRDRPACREAEASSETSFSRRRRLRLPQLRRIDPHSARPLGRR